MLTSGIDDQVNVKLARNTSSMSHGSTLHYFTDVEVCEISLHTQDTSLMSSM